MRAFVREHKRNLVIGHSVVIAAFLLTTITSLDDAHVTLFFTPHGEGTIAPGAAVSLDVNVHALSPVNAFDVVVSYPADMIELIDINEETSFLDLWPHNEKHPAKDGSAELHFTAGVFGRDGFTGTGTALTLNLRAKKAGTAEFVFKDPQIRASDGKGTLVPADARSFTYTVVERAPAATGSAGSTFTVAVPVSIPDFDGDGLVTIIDASMLLVQMFASYNPRYDLNIDGAVGVADLSVLLSKLRM